MCQVCTEVALVVTSGGLLFSIWCAFKHQCMACVLGFHKWIHRYTHKSKYKPVTRTFYDCSCCEKSKMIKTKGDSK